MTLVSGCCIVEIENKLQQHIIVTSQPRPNNAVSYEWPSGLNSSRQVTEVMLGRVRSNFGWVTSEA